MKTAEANAQPANVVKWAEVLMGVVVQEKQSKAKHTLLSVDTDGGAWIFSSKDKVPSYIVIEELVPAADQLWIAIQYFGLETLVIGGFNLAVVCDDHHHITKFKITGLQDGWKMEGAV